MRRVNDVSEAIHWPMPHIDTALTDLTGSAVYAKLDFSHGYWQIALDEKSRECQSFGTDEGIWTPTRVLQGSKNSSAYFQAATSKIYKPLRERLLQWLDDWLMHAKTEGELLNTLKVFFVLSREYRVKLNAKKCTLFTREVTWCGRKISAEGVTYDPRRLEGLKIMHSPTNGAELQQFITSINWMRQSIPNYNVLTAPFYNVLEEVYASSGRRTRKAAEKIKLSSTGWNEKHVECFQNVQNALRNAVTLAHYDPKKRLCLFTDASQTHWASVLTQVPHEDLSKPIHDQAHEPLAFLSGNFKGASANWSVPEKEGYSIVTSMMKLDYMTMCENGVSIYTDHRNLLYIFDPKGQDANVSQHVVSKLTRWALKLSAFSYTITHISGESNVWADMLTRWTKQPLMATSGINQLYTTPNNISFGAREPISWPDAAEIKNAQSEYANESTNMMYNDKDGMKRFRRSNAIWIPDRATSLQLRLLIISHCGIGGHRASDSTRDKLAGRYAWKTLRADVKQFVQTCFHCVATNTPDRMPRPMGHQIHSTTPNEVIHFDYLFIGEAKEGYEYIVIIKDDFSGYVWLLPCRHADAWTTAKHLMSWFASFGISTKWVSDRGSHF